MSNSKFNNKSKTVAVNAVSLYSGGGLNILKQFVNNIKDNNNYLIFINSNINTEDLLRSNRHKNIKLIKIKNNNFKKITWEALGLKQFLNKTKIKADIVISLQNTSINYGKDIPQIIYLHQGIFLYPKKWSFFKLNERKLAFYKYIYPFFVFLFVNNNTKFVVQTEWMQQSLIKNYKINKDNIYILKPEVNIPIKDLDGINSISLKHKYSIFYPTSSFKFKNYQEILDGLIYIKNNIKNTNIDLKDIGYYLTIDKSSDLEFWHKIKQNNLEDNIVFLGNLGYSKVFEYYKSCSIVAFPSYIESFGLPLLEAVYFSKPIIAINNRIANYAKEVLQGYRNVSFADIHSPESWGQAIIYKINHLNSNKNISANNNVSYNSGWKEFFELI